MRFIDSVEEAIDDYVKVAKKLKDSGLALSDYEAMRLAIECFKADSLEGIDDFVVMIDDQKRPIQIKIVGDENL